LSLESIKSAANDDAALDRCLAATLLTADLGWQQQFRNAANAAVFTNVALWTCCMLSAYRKTKPP